MRTHCPPSVLLAAALLWACVGCAGPRLAVSPAEAASPPAPPSDAELRLVRANELGRIPVLMYHSVGAPGTRRGPRFDRRGLNIPVERFERHLEAMHQAGWFPVNVRDAVRPGLDVPAGKTPVAITFDDARGSQLRLLPDGSVDPNCAVGILMRFSRKHPDWPLRATFYVMPRSSWNPAPFWQPGLEARKLRLLTEMGFEVGNHSVTHRAFRGMQPAAIRWEVAQCARDIRKLEPRATMDTLALPYGSLPSSRAQWRAAMGGTQQGKQYRNRCIVIVGGGAAYPPAHKLFNPMRVARIGSDVGNIETWIRRLGRGGTVAPYVSDGRADMLSVPRRLAGAVNASRLGAVRLAVYDPAPPAAVAASKGRAARTR